jgi:hypothetical protein
MWTWVFIIIGYAAGMLAFHLLGGITAAARAIETWGRTSSTRRVERSGLGSRGFAEARLGKAVRGRGSVLRRAARPPKTPS